MDQTDTYQQLIASRVLSPAFVRATFSGAQRGQSVPWLKVILRPVEVKGREQIQFSYFDGKKDITKNYAGEPAAEELEALLAAGFRNFHVLTAAEELQINLSSKGRPLITRKQPAAPVAVDRSHNRKKRMPLPEGTPDPFLHAVGIMNAEGQVRPSMYDKFRQINEFLKIVDHAIKDQVFPREPISIVDFGCGNAYLTFAIYHYLRDVLGMPAQVVGIDRNQELIARNTRLAEKLGWDAISFQVGSILDFQPGQPIEIVLALHACDTATDEALAQAIRCGSRFIFSAPCCHHHLQEQLDRQPARAPFQPVLRHGILSERLGDVLTDAFRAAILRILGYSTDVFQFVSSEHTAKNLMIRAIRSVKPGDARFVQEYAELKQFWNVTPYLEQILDAGSRSLVCEGAPAQSEGRAGSLESTRLAVEEQLS